MQLTEEFTVEHVKHASGGPHDYMRSLCLELLDLAADVSPSYAGVAPGTHVVTQGQDHLLDLWEEEERWNVETRARPVMGDNAD